MDELSERLSRLEPLRNRPRSDFAEDPYLRDIVERNLEVAAQCCIDIASRLIAMEGAQKPSDYQEAIARLGEIGVLSVEFARRLAPIAGFRNILVHEYLVVDWDKVHANLQRLDDLKQFVIQARAWMLKQSNH